jgi:hypothetical protein
MSKTGIKKVVHSESNLEIKVRPLDSNQKALDAISKSLIEHRSVQKYLKGKKCRMLFCELVDSDASSEIKTSRPTTSSDLYRATLYDYTTNRTIIVEGRLNKRSSLKIIESNNQPLPSNEEFDEAVEILMKDSELGSAMREKALQVYRPMPPLINEELPDGNVERTIAIGLLPADNGLKHEIVGVNLISQRVIRFKEGAPPTSMASGVTCGLPSASQPITNKGTLGQIRVTVTQGSNVLWTFIAVRPAASSGTNGSGIELQFVNYRGKRVLYRAHAPILNIKYDHPPCGPYRDWEYKEGMIQANGTDVAPGFRLCPTPAKTIFDSGTDTGNFLGTAIYVEGQEVVLVSEMEAGWYRYISEWRLHANGTIKPRFGFSAVNNSCVCDPHHHHVYWRFDFDIRTPGNNIVREYNNPPLFPPDNWHTKRYEIKRLRDPARHRKWEIKNGSTDERYTLIPGANDGVADSFAKGDVWILRYHGSELDDGAVALGPPYEAGIDRFVNGELIEKQDVVVWYAAHFTHIVSPEMTGSHIVGPDLVPFRW